MTELEHGASSFGGTDIYFFDRSTDLEIIDDSSLSDSFLEVVLGYESRQFQGDGEKKIIALECGRQGSAYLFEGCDKHYIGQLVPGGDGSTHYPCPTANGDHQCPLYFMIFQTVSGVNYYVHFGHTNNLGLGSECKQVVGAPGYGYTDQIGWGG